MERCDSYQMNKQWTHGITVSIRAHQRNKTDRILKETYFKELAHMLVGLASPKSTVFGTLETLSEVIAAVFRFYSPKDTLILLDLGPTLIQHILNLITFTKTVFQIHVSGRHKFVRLTLFSQAQSFCHCVVIIVDLRQRKRK